MDCTMNDDVPDITEEEAALHARVKLLRQEHDDLSASIDALSEAAVPDQLLIARLKRKKLALRLGPAGVVALIDLWLTAAETHPDGNLAGYDAEDVELDAGWAGDPGAFAVAAEQCGWLDRTEAGYYLHDWSHHQPWLIGAKDRQDRGRAAVMQRWERERAKATQPAPTEDRANTASIRPVYAANTEPIPLSSPFPSPQSRWQ
jgi:hypothetical protein